ncbi:LPS export ABC transporter periplasmic protein LptC, partial [Prochlorococcus sp.]|jgi:lipopolysaccharide export system protein LptA|uniref:LPS export ABC transporter periplasmic protein LptC n=1 Tax=Prochlorococcus sp. TaxID=1220 RepID=UPI0038879F50
MKRLLLAAVLFLLSEISFAKEKLNYTVTSDSQIQNVKGNFEAIGNVVIKSSKNNFEASSNKLTYDKDARTLKLVGNVFVKNLESDQGLSIQESYGDELTIFTDTGLFKFNSENKNRVKTKLKF